MHPKWEILYTEMLADIERCKKMELPETERTESCYRVSVNYWFREKELFMSRVIYDDMEEITFFKTVKPQFTCYIEYYLVLNQGLLFIPGTSEERLLYWQEEAKRHQRFCDRHADFIRYYESSKTDQDANYFLQRNNRNVAMPQERIYEDADCRSSHDHLVRGLFANRMYHEYVLEKIRQLQDTVKNDEEFLRQKVKD